MKQQALEFSSIIQEGVIRLPDEYGNFMEIDESVNIISIDDLKLSQLIITRLI